MITSTFSCPCLSYKHDTTATDFRLHHLSVWYNPQWRWGESTGGEERELLDHWVLSSHTQPHGEGVAREEELWGVARQTPGEGGGGV